MIGIQHEGGCSLAWLPTSSVWSFILVATLKLRFGPEPHLILRVRRELQRLLRGERLLVHHWEQGRLINFCLWRENEGGGTLSYLVRGVLIYQQSLWWLPFDYHDLFNIYSH
jgi:hypothetical protein